MRSVTFNDYTGMNLLLPHTLFLNMIGIFPDNKQKKICVMITNLVGALVFIITIIQCIFTINYLPVMFSTQNYAKLSIGINYTSVAVSCLHKYYLMRSKKAIFQRLGEWTVNTQMLHQRNKVPQHLAVRVAGFANRSFYISCIAAAANWILWPFISQSGASIPSSLPTSWTAMLLIPQSVIILYFVAVIVFFTSTIANVLGLMCSEIQYVSQRMKELTYDPNNPSEFTKNMISYVKEHVENYRFLEDVRKIHSGMFSYQVFISISIACAFIFGMLKKGVLYKAIFYILPIASASIPEFFLMCWLGEEITDQFRSIHWNIYNNNWYEAPPAVRRQLVIILQISEKPVYLVGAKVFKASLNLFIEAMRQAFSLYTVLKAMTGD